MNLLSRKLWRGLGCILHFAVSLGLPVDFPPNVAGRSAWSYKDGLGSIYLLHGRFLDLLDVFRNTLVCSITKVILPFLVKLSAIALNQIGGLI